jgi:hypothetical protein
MRRADECLKCGQEKPIVGHGLCAKCHLQWWRLRKEQEEEENLGIPGAPRPDRSQRRYQEELSDQRIVLCKVVRMLERTKVVETALSTERVSSIIAELNRAIRVIDNAKQYPENTEIESSENPNNGHHTESAEEFSENLKNELSENSEGSTGEDTDGD